MFCHSCGTQVTDDVQFCPNCGQSLSAPVPGSAARSPLWSRPSASRPRPGHWIGAGWDMVKADIGNYALLGLVFIVLNALVPVILQGPLFAGFHIYCMKRILGPPRRIRRPLQGLQLLRAHPGGFADHFALRLRRHAALRHSGTGGRRDVQIHLPVHRR